ncbi:MAG: aldehyde ferredoxin oxidoreductase N-terminal domain-containing protein [Candidatus Delongbacteria bacterium]
MDVKGLRSKHRMLKEMSYEPSVLDRGYSGKSLYFNLSDNTIRIKEVTEMMKDKFIGGKGFGLWLLWNGVNKDTKWDSSENQICFASGPLGGTTSFPGSGKTLVTSISPTTGSVIDSNVGGHFGPLLKFAGFDAMEIQGKAEKDVIISINSITKKLEIFEAPEEALDSHVVSEQLTEMYSENEDERRNISVVAAGSGSDHTLIGCLNFSWWDYRRDCTRIKQAGRGGIGSVFRNKKIKAVIVKTPNMRPKWTIEQRKEKP